MSENARVFARKKPHRLVGEADVIQINPQRNARVAAAVSARKE